MLKFLLVFTLFGSASAANPELVIESGNLLFNLIRRELPTDVVEIYPNYVPEYGLQINGSIFLRQKTPVQLAILASSISLILRTSSTIVEGLGEDDWVSLSTLVFSTDIIYLSVRVKPNQPDSLEIWVDGVKQPEDWP